MQIFKPFDTAGAARLPLPPRGEGPPPTRPPALCRGGDGSRRGMARRGKNPNQRIRGLSTQMADSAKHTRKTGFWPQKGPHCQRQRAPGGRWAEMGDGLGGSGTQPALPGDQGRFSSRHPSTAASANHPGAPPNPGTGIYSPREATKPGRSTGMAYGTSRAWERRCNENHEATGMISRRRGREAKPARRSQHPPRASVPKLSPGVSGCLCSPNPASSPQKLGFGEGG